MCAHAGSATTAELCLQYSTRVTTPSHPAIATVTTNNSLSQQGSALATTWMHQYLSPKQSEGQAFRSELQLQSQFEQSHPSSSSDAHSYEFCMSSSSSQVNPKQEGTQRSSKAPQENTCATTHCGIRPSRWCCGEQNVKF